MKVVAVVPMKLNNQRLANKNIKEFSNGKVLCQYILETLLKVKKIDEIYVYCSNKKIKQYLPNNIKYLKRSELLDQDTTKMNEVLKEFSKEIDADIYVMTHATSPFVSYESIDDALEYVINEKNDSALAVKKVQDFLWLDNKPFNYELENIPRTQDLKPLYMETSGFYIYRKNIIEEHGRRVGFNPYLKEVNEIEAIDIDELGDFQIADAIISSGILER